MVCALMNQIGYFLKRRINKKVIKNQTSETKPLIIKKIFCEGLVPGSFFYHKKSNATKTYKKKTKRT